VPAQESGPRPPQRDQVALDLLAKAVNAAGGPVAIASVQDLKGTGKITFYWGDHPTGDVTMRGRTGGGFRVDSFLSDGNLTSMSNGTAGSRKERDGTNRQMSFQQAMHYVDFAFPIGHVINALKSPSTEITNLGVENYAESTRQVYRIRVRKELVPGEGLDNLDTKLTIRDLLIDTGTFEIVGVEDNFRVSQGKESDHGLREIEFSDYRNVQGVMLPFSISTKLASQKTMEIHLDSITLNTGVSDSDFER
jgi:hypothetical protein